MQFTLQNIFIGTTILGITSGVLGVFGMLRQQSLLSDVISHAAFPGIAIAFWMTLSKSLIVLMIGGACAGLLGALSVVIITTYTHLKKDAALGMVLSVFFGIGLVILTHIQKLPISNQSILNKFLFGNAATLLPEDIYLIFIVGCGTLAVTFSCLKEFILVTFDPLYAKVLGYRIMWWDIAITLLQVITIVIGLQTVGVVLMSTLLIAPAAAARQWTYSLPIMIFLAALFGGTASIMGTIISCAVPRLPTGPVIVVILSSMVTISVLIAPHRGVLWHRVMRKDIL
jgi:manganese/zinc/iron transport system permease protein